MWARHTFQDSYISKSQPRCFHPSHCKSTWICRNQANLSNFDQSSKSYSWISNIIATLYPLKNYKGLSSSKIISSRLKTYWCFFGISVKFFEVVFFQKNDTIRNKNKKNNDTHHRFSPEGQHIQVLDLCAAPGSKAEKLGGWVLGGGFSYGFLQQEFLNPIKKGSITV